jgi:hypothetical protein
LFGAEPRVHRTPVEIGWSATVSLCSWLQPPLHELLLLPSVPAHRSTPPPPLKLQGLSPAFVAVETLPRCPPPSAASPVLRRYGEPHPLSPCPTNSLYDPGACDAASATPSRSDHRRRPRHGRRTARGARGSGHVGARHGHGPQRPLGPLKPWTDRGHGPNATCYCSSFFQIPEFLFRFKYFRNSINF